MKAVPFILFSSFFLTAGLSGLCQPQSVSLMTDDGDRIVVSYEISEDGDDLLLSFPEVNVKKRSGKLLELMGKGGKADVQAVMFDRRGNLPLFSSEETIVPLSVPAELEYTASGDGVFFLQESPVLKFKRLTRTRDIQFTLPIYIAVRQILHSGYRLVGKTGLEIRVAAEEQPELPDGESVSSSADGVSGDSSESEGRDYSEINQSVSIVKTITEQQMALPFSETFMIEIAKLRTWADDESVAQPVREKIRSALGAYEKKIGELERKEESAKQQVKEEEERREAEQQAEELRRELQEEQRALEEKKSRLKMIIGGIVLAVVGVIGNQFLQYFRNMKTQKGMMEMQQMMANRVQKKAESKARQFASGGVSKVKRKVGQEKNDLIKRSKNDLIKKNQNKNGKPTVGGTRRNPPRYTI